MSLRGTKCLPQAAAASPACIAYRVCPCKWRHGVSPSCMEANQANALQVYSECLELGTQKSNCFVQISGHFSSNCPLAFTSMRATALQLL